MTRGEPVVVNGKGECRFRRREGCDGEYRAFLPRRRLEAAEKYARIHDRMPVMLPKDVIDDWISPAVDPKEVLLYSITDVVAEKAEKTA